MMNYRSHFLYARSSRSVSQSSIRQRVGWVERSETHRLGGVVMLGRMMGFATLYPSYELKQIDVFH
jgi:hypothetical protein